jgi:hypothetical protein
VVSLSEIDAYSEAIDSLSAVAFAQVKALLLSLDDPNPIVFRDALLATYPELLAPFTTAASQVAASWYSTLRANAGITGTFRPALAPTPPTAQLDAGVRYSLTPLFQPQQFIGSDILSLLAGFTQRMIADAGRDTISRSAVRDSVRTGWARIPRVACCAFCALLGSRGAVYKSETTAGGEGNRYHNHCRCVVAPKFPGADNDYLAEVQQHFDGIYADAQRQFGQGKGLANATAAVRELTGSK